MLESWPKEKESDLTGSPPAIPQAGVPVRQTSTVMWEPYLEEGGAPRWKQAGSPSHRLLEGEPSPRGSPEKGYT